MWLFLKFQVGINVLSPPFTALRQELNGTLFHMALYWNVACMSYLICREWILVSIFQGLQLRVHEPKEGTGLIEISNWDLFTLNEKILQIL